MSTKLIQKHWLKGTHEFEIVGDQVNLRIKPAFKPEETLSITLAVLNPDPVITRSHLEFVSRVNGETLLSLALSRPNVTAFNDFVHTLKHKAQAEYNAISGMQLNAEATELEPPEFSDVSTADIIKHKTVNVEGVENAIHMLQTYIDKDEIQPLLTALESLRQTPQDRARLIEVATVFNQLETTQGAVLTYAPYISILLSDDPFGSS